MRGQGQGQGSGLGHEANDHEWRQQQIQSVMNQVQQSVSEQLRYFLLQSKLVKALRPNKNSLRGSEVNNDPLKANVLPSTQVVVLF